MGASSVQRIRHGPSEVLDQVGTRNRVWNPDTLDWELETGKESILGPSIAAVTKVSSSATNVTLKAANALRLALSVFNDSTKVLYIKFGTIAALDDFTVKVLAGGYFEAPYPCYTGKVDGIWDIANGNAFVTEMTL